jgi:hypothetical protein
MSQSTDDLTRSELRAIRGHYQRRVWLSFLIPALIAVAGGGCCSKTKTSTPVRRPRQRPRTTVSGPITREVVQELCGRPPGGQHHAGPGTQALKDWRLHAKALDDYREGKISLAKARRRWDETTKVGLAGADCFDKQAEIYKKAATTCK